MNNPAGVGDWATRKLKSAKEVKEERKQNEEKAPPVKNTETIKAGPIFKVWPKEEDPQQKIVYQWKCPQPSDNEDEMKLVQAGYACAVHFRPQCTHVLISGTNFDEDGFPNTRDHHHITVSYRNGELKPEFFETAHCYTDSKNYLRVTDFKSTGIKLAYTQGKSPDLRYWPDPKDAMIEAHIGRPYAQQVDVAIG